MAAIQAFSHLPHISKTQAGYNKWDPVHKAIFQVNFQLPDGIKDIAGTDNGGGEVLLSEQVIKVSGLDVLQKTVQAGEQKFFGASVSFLNPVLDNTYAEFTIEFNLNLRKTSDNYVLKVFKAWEKMGYDLSDGTRTLMVDYCADNLSICEANRDGTIWREYTFHKVLLTDVTGLDDLDYSSNDARTLTCKFRADWWDENLA